MIVHVLFMVIHFLCTFNPSLSFADSNSPSSKLTKIGLKKSFNTFCWGADRSAKCNQNQSMSDLEILRDFYNSLDGPHWTWSSVSWNFSGPNIDPCSANWQGMKCNNGLITELRLTFMGLSGTIPASFRSLSSLQVLILDGNSIHGTIPTSFENIQDLSLYDNRFSGSIPNEFFAPGSKLRKLNLEFNKIVGTIPETIGLATELEVLLLYANLFSGSLPENMRSLTRVRVINLGFNQFEGIVTHLFETWTVLKHLNLVHNSFTGKIPEFSPLSLVEDIALSYNRFIGSLPPSYAEMTTLRKLNCEFNLLTGTLPKEIGLLTQLQELSIKLNHFRGTVPFSISNLLKLSVLSIGDNKFSGTITTLFQNMSKLTFLNLAVNNFHGRLPTFHYPAAPNTHPMSLFSYANNGFTGPVPLEYKNLVNLEFFYLNQNSLTSLPGEIFVNLTRIKEVDVRLNNFHGSIPYQLGLLRKCSRVWLTGNSFSGQIPDSFANLIGLGSLMLDDNALSGTLPSFLNNLPIFAEAFLSHNHFSGSLVLRHDLLHVLDVHYNYLHGTLPDDLFTETMTKMNIFIISENYFSGTIPSFIQYWQSSLIVLNLGNNRFTGTIPSFLSECSSLTNLNLCNNALTGHLPPLPHSSLKSLFLNKNRLSGSLSAALKGSNLSSLQIFDVGDNSFTGDIHSFSSIFSSNSIKEIRLANNSLGKELEKTVSGFESLMFFDASNNQFTGNFAGVFDISLQRSLKIIDVSSNRLTGSVPDELFTMLRRSLTIFSAGKNCLVSSIPETVCQDNVLEVLALDGMTSSDACKLFYFPHSLVKSYYLNAKDFINTIPACLFTLPNLTTLHLSGNLITGSLPDDTDGIYLTDSYLEDMSLADNQISGTIPECFQVYPWTKLDLSFNKLTGTLSTEISAFDGEEDSLSLGVNRLSGRIPDTLLSASGISILAGNMFDCVVDGVQQQLPSHDKSVPSYQCGSSSVNAALAIWTIILFCAIVIPIIGIMLYHNSSDLNKEDIENDEEPQIKDKPMIMVSEHSFSVRKIIRWWHKMASIRHHEDTFIEAHARQYYGIIEFCRFVSELQTYTIGIALGILIFFVPSFLALSKYYRTHEFTYIWVVSMAYMSGDVAAYFLFALFISFHIVLFVTLFHRFWNKGPLPGKQTAAPAISPRSISCVSWWKGISLKKIVFYFLITLVNCSVMLAINIGYIFFLDRGLTKAQSSFLQFFVALFKISWSYSFFKWFIRDVFHYLQDQEKDQSQERVTQAELQLITFSSLLNIFNSTIAPMIATALFDPNCFKYLIFQPPETTSLYYFLRDFFLKIPIPSQYAVLAEFVDVELIKKISYFPSFHYNFQCTSTLLNEFIVVFVYKYTMKILWSLAGIGVEQLLFYRNKNLSKRLLDWVPSLSNVGKFLLLRRFDPDYNGDLPPQPHKRHKIYFFDASMFIINVLTDFSVLLTFGITFPFLAVIVCISLLIHINFQKLLIGRLICEFENTLKIIDPIPPSRESQGEGKKKDIEGEGGGEEDRDKNDSGPWQIFCPSNREGVNDDVKDVQVEMVGGVEYYRLPETSERDEICEDNDEGTISHPSPTRLWESTRGEEPLSVRSTMSLTNTRSSSLYQQVSENLSMLETGAVDGISRAATLITEQPFDVPHPSPTLSSHRSSVDQRHLSSSQVEQRNIEVVTADKEKTFQGTASISRKGCWYCCVEGRKIWKDVASPETHADEEEQRPLSSAALGIHFYLKKLNDECLTLEAFFIPNVPYLSFFSCLFLSFFLFDILGDDLGVTASIWIFPATIVIPWMILWGSHVVRYCLVHGSDSGTIDQSPLPSWTMKIPLIGSISSRTSRRNPADSVSSPDSDPVISPEQSESNEAMDRQHLEIDTISL